MLATIRRRSLVATAVATAGIASGLAYTPAQAATDPSPGAVTDQFGTPVLAAGNCGDVFNPVINGAKAHWELTCSGGYVTMTGWVDDTSADGRCAYVRGEFQDGAVELAKNCPADSPRTNFEWKHSGNRAYGFLYVS